MRTHRTMYFLNLHDAGVFNTFICGQTGSGKSVLVQDLIVHALKYDPFVTILDHGRSYEALTKLVGGTYVRLGGEKLPFEANPFELQPTPGNLRFLFQFFRFLIEVL